MTQNKNIAPIEDIRRHQMRALFDDLHALERKGLEDKDCDLVKAALASVSSAAAEIPDGSFWSGTILRESERVYDAYDHWNGIKGENEEAADRRKAALRKLRKRRQRLARRVHRNQFVLKNELDNKLVAAMYTAFGKLVEGSPKLFVHLARAIS